MPTRCWFLKAAAMQVVMEVMVKERENFWMCGWKDDKDGWKDDKDGWIDEKWMDI